MPFRFHSGDPPREPLPNVNASAPASEISCNRRNLPQAVPTPHAYFSKRSTAYDGSVAWGYEKVGLDLKDIEGIDPPRFAFVRDTEADGCFAIVNDDGLPLFSFDQVQMFIEELEAFGSSRSGTTRTRRRSAPERMNTPQRISPGF